MFNASRYLSAIISFLIVATISIPTSLLAKSAKNVSKIAEDITVLIKDNNYPAGSGIIIEKQQDTYYVLTAKHVVELIDWQENPYLVTDDEQKHLLFKGNVQEFPEIDLAIIKFSSLESYRVAIVGNSATVKEGNISYVSGFPNPSVAIDDSVFNFTEGLITANSKNSLRDGYSLIYSNNTLPGMSGGPVLNEQGHLIGVHGRADAQAPQATDNPHIFIKTGFNLGIPINVLDQYKNLSSFSLRYADAKKSKITPQLYKLEGLLQNKQYWEADLETKDLLLGSKKYLDESGIKNLNCDSLIGIDELWKKNSRGRFGFTVQKLIWDDDYNDFANDTGWLYRGSWSPPQKSQYNSDAPRGHLPRQFLDGEIWSFFIDKLDKCGL